MTPEKMQICQKFRVMLNSLDEKSDDKRTDINKYASYYHSQAAVEIAQTIIE